MELDVSNFLWIILLATGLFLMYFLLYKSYIYSFVDPIFLFTIATAFSSVLVIEVVREVADVVHFFLCQFAVLIGFRLYYRNKSKENSPQLFSNLGEHFSDKKLLEWATLFLFILYVSANLFIAYSKGFTLLSSAPTEAKVANFQNGFGIIRKINWGVGTFLCSSLIFLYLLRKNKVYLVLLSIISFFIILDGSKSSLLRVAIAAGLIFYHPLFETERATLVNLKKYSVLFTGALFAVIFTVLLKENDGIDEAAIAFLRRLLYGGDVVLFYYNPVNLDFFEDFNLVDYLVRFVNPISGFFRIQPYQEALGNVMIENIRPPGVTLDVIVGPNTPFYVEGRIFFGYFGGIIYSALIGYSYAAVRNFYFSISKSNAFFFVLMASIAQLLAGLLVDVNLTITQTFDLLFFSLPVYTIVAFVFDRRLKVSWTVQRNHIN